MARMKKRRIESANCAAGLKSRNNSAQGNALGRTVKTTQPCKGVPIAPAFRPPLQGLPVFGSFPRATLADSLCPGLNWRAPLGLVPDCRNKH
jgi:hypothetical protein